MVLKLTDDKPIYLQIKEYIEDSIMDDVMKAGERVPSTNELAKHYQINPATARQGMNELVSANILQIKRGVGMFVTDEAKGILIEERQQTFYENYIIPMQKEAKKLQITNEQLYSMLKRKGNNIENKCAKYN